jgi:hypothetical protein
LSSVSSAISQGPSFGSELVEGFSSQQVDGGSARVPMPPANGFIDILRIELDPKANTTSSFGGD